ncbi:hypothetical protein [Guggenheimella bovis]
MKRIFMLALLFLLLLGCSKTEDVTKVGRLQAAPHGLKSFADIVVFLKGDVIEGVSIEEYQFLPRDKVKGVPNSDENLPGTFGHEFRDETFTLATKSLNSDYYSKEMKTVGNATKTFKENHDALEAFIKGKTVKDLEKYIESDTKDNDALSSCTLVDKKEYLKAVIEACKVAK